MRILIVCPYTWNRPGGVKTHVTDAALALLKLGHSVVVIGPVDGDPELPVGWGIATSKTSIPLNGALFQINSGKTIQFGGTQIDVTWMNNATRDQVKGFIKSFSPDVIHFHTPWTPFFSIQLLQVATELRNDRTIHSRFIATFHDTPSESGLGKFLGDYVMPLTARYFMRMFDQVIAVSEPQSRYLTRFTQQTVHVIPNGIRTPEFIESEYHHTKWEKVGPYILFLGRLELRKGLLDAIEMFRLISPKHKDVKLIVAGDGPLRKQAEKMVAECGLKQIVFTGQVSDSEKWDLMIHAKLYLAPALYGESFGIVLLEALSVGTPVVGYANNGYKSVISGYFDDLFVKPGNVSELAEIVSNLVENEEKLHVLSKKGLILSENYHWETIIKKITRLYCL